MTLGTHAAYTRALFEVAAEEFLSEEASKLVPVLVVQKLRCLYEQELSDRRKQYDSILRNFVGTEPIINQVEETRNDVSERRSGSSIVVESLCSHLALPKGNTSPAQAESSSIFSLSAPMPLSTGQEIDTEGMFQSTAVTRRVDEGAEAIASKPNYYASLGRGISVEQAKMYGLVDPTCAATRRRGANFGRLPPLVRQSKRLRSGGTLFTKTAEYIAIANFGFLSLLGGALELVFTDADIRLPGFYLDGDVNDAETDEDVSDEMLGIVTAPASVLADDT